MLISNPLGKVQKSPKKIPCSVTFLLITFFMSFLQLFQRIQNQDQFLRFSISVLRFLGTFKKIIFALFANFEVKRGRNSSKKLFFTDVP
jgi:hypothetical protein